MGPAKTSPQEESRKASVETLTVASPLMKVDFGRQEKNSLLCSKGRAGEVGWTSFFVC